MTDASVYTRAMETRECIDEDVTLVIRPITPADEARIGQFFRELGSGKTYRRSPLLQDCLPFRNVRRFCKIDYDTHVTLVASLQVGEAEKVIGCALYILDVPTGFAECTVVVAEPYQRCGYGTRLVRRLVDIAQARGVRGFSAVARYADDALPGVFRKCGCQVESVRRADRAFLRITLGPVPRGSGQG